MSKATRLVAVLVGLFAVASLVHYALFGSFPFGTPQLLAGEADGTAAIEVER
ncbi:hypothetical protein [Halomarina litorea]|uniref:hypothetical protein n=1 Tax=Halomarina litorea TaxID=2961595 RepID=UPI0020C2EF37|nr:hypothetical protein [Halomarina sp. BCD28]